MRLIFSTTDYKNTNISDEQGNVLYNVSTPSGFMTRKVTTIRKYGRDGQGESMGIIEWPRLIEEGLFRFDGKVIPISAMFEKRMWSSGLYFVGPDQHSYKWKVYPRCWMKPAESNVELVRFHRKNMGIMKPSHPAYLDVSPGVVSMLDFIILTFVYAEWKHQERERRRRRATNMGGPSGGIVTC